MGEVTAMIDESRNLKLYTENIAKNGFRMTQGITSPDNAEFVRQSWKVYIFYFLGGWVSIFFSLDSGSGEDTDFVLKGIPDSHRSCFSIVFPSKEVIAAQSK